MKTRIWHWLRFKSVYIVYPEPKKVEGSYFNVMGQSIVSERVWSKKARQIKARIWHWVVKTFLWGGNK